MSEPPSQLSRVPQVTVQIRRGNRPTCKVELPGIKVRVLEGPDEGAQIVRAGGRIRMGSASDNDLVLTDPTVSRHHAELCQVGNGLELRDLGSTNGSFLGDVEVKQAPIPLGSEFLLGTCRLLVEAAVVQRVSLIREEDGLGDLVGSSPAMQELFALIRAVAPTEAGVLLLGESGTGKELISKEIHRLSGRKGPLVIFDAAVADPEMIRSDLFGHVAGAFTGAAGPRTGAFREADGGTLFLDEVGELPLDLQPRLLRALESGEVAPMGTDRHVTVDVRVVAATHRDLSEMVAAGTFREDLFHRLSVLPVRVPPLRERVGDVARLARALAERKGLDLVWTPEAEQALEAREWPGNVRALRNVVERLGVLVQGRPVTATDLEAYATGPLKAPIEDAVGGSAPARDAPSDLMAAPGVAPGGGTLDLAQLERQAIRAALAKHPGNRQQAADELGISLATLKRRLKQYRDEGEEI
jgi:DNA-binding NtrC family response regulator